MNQLFGDLFNTKILELEKYSLSLMDVVVFIAILVGARVLVWILTLILQKSLIKRTKVDQGRRFAFIQIIKYFIYTISVVVAIESLGLNLGVLLASSAALFVGLGLGLQQTFNDFISGIILLFEGSIEVGDVVEVGSLVGRVKEIGIRTSKVETRESIYIIVPNSKFVGDNVTNWSHNRKSTRFDITVGVAYGSDVDLVKKCMLGCAKRHNLIVKTPAPFVRFANFGNSSLDFELYFWTDEAFWVENTKSDLRFMIDKLFREHEITIAFPQRDIHIKTNEAGLGNKSNS